MKLENATLVIKLSGKNIDDADCLDDISRQAVALQKLGAQVILVHGGGMRINQALKDAGISPKFHQGQRVTDDATMEIVARVLCDEVNSELAEAIKKKGGEVIYGKQTQVLFSAPLDNDLNSGEYSEGNDAKRVKLGRVGKAVDSKPILGLNGQIAVMAPVAHDLVNGLEYNVNADWAAAAIAVSYKANYLFYMTDQDGVLDADSEVINQISRDQIDGLIEQGIVTDGMIPKILSMRDALDQGVKRIVVVNGTTRNVISDVLNGEVAGTAIY
ncbi:MAG: acetylglutamate kinase [Candidatus Portiera sp.]|nr:acetylglutamate kinase [Portiera sp.]